MLETALNLLTLSGRSILLHVMCPSSKSQLAYSFVLGNVYKVHKNFIFYLFHFKFILGLHMSKFIYSD